MTTQWLPNPARHPFAALMAAPLLGALFVVFLPFLGFFMIGKLCWQKMIGLGRQAAHARYSLE